MHKFGLFVLVAAINLSACSPAARQNTARVMTAAASGAASGAAGPSYSTKLMLFGGSGHKTYLGCLSCSQYASDSVFNSYGPHGSAYASESIWNHYSEFGSAYSMYGACNAYASDPPVIVDSNGNYYGRMTMNQYHPQRAAGARYYEWLAGSVCN